MKREKRESMTDGTQHPEPPRWDWRAAVLVLATIVVYIPSMTAGFVWDDDRFLHENPLIQAADGLRRFWFSAEAPDYFPLTSTTLWLEWRLWGHNAAGYHVTNILLHAASSLLLWRILARLGIGVAWGAALLWALHPVNVESVTWITERKNTLSFFFCALSVWAFLRSETGGPSARRWHGASLGFFLMGLLSKTSVTPLPMALLLILWWKRGRIRREDLLQVAPFFILAFILGLVTVWFQYNVNIGTDVVRTDSFPERILTAGWAVWFYLWKALLPLGLCFVYTSPEFPLTSLASWIPLAALLAAAGLLIWKRRHPVARDAALAIGWFVVMLLPVLGFLDIYFMRYSLVSDHWQHLALPALVALVTAGGARLCAWVGLPKPAALTVAAIALGAITIHEQAAYRDEDTLWHATIRCNPDAWLAHNNLAVLLEREGHTDRAEHHFREAVRAWPEYREAHFNLGNVLLDTGRPAEALQHFNESVQIDPAYAVAWNNGGNALLAVGRAEEALTYFQAALGLQPEYPDALANQGNALQALGRSREALAAWQRVLQMDPQHTAALNGLGLYHAARQDFDEAAQWFQQAVAADPASGEARFNLASALHLQGQPEDAIREYREALRLMPGNEQVRVYLNQALEEAGQDAH